MTEPDDVGSAFAAADEALRRAEFAWIARSALTERAYWLGLLHGLAALRPGGQLEETAFTRLRRAADPRPGDDAFRDDTFGEALALIRDAIEDPRAPELETMEVMLDATIAHLEEVQHERTTAAADVRETAARILPYTRPESFRGLSAEEHERLKDLVAALEESLRKLALVELRWGRRLGVDPSSS